MEIHGNDISIKSKIPIADNLIRLLIQDHWPDMVYEIDERPNATDMFVYFDEEAKEAWNIEGWSEKNDLTMIYIIFAENATKISFTFDDNKKNKPIIDDLLQFIRNCNEGE